MATLSVTLAFAQGPTVTHPYLYDTFLDGTVVLDNGQRENRKMNIHLRRDALHYLDNGIVKEAFLHDVAAVEIGKDVFLPVEGQMMKLLAKNDKCCVVAQITGDFDAARESTGAYGITSSTSATMKVSSIQTDSQVNQNYMNILNEKENGASLDLVTKLWIIAPGFRSRATKKDVADALPQEKKEGFQAFLKTHKIKWKDPQSILTLSDYL
ncbi:MAG: hypothetical protein ACI4TM_03570 [Candidatus Cryptobacteroides sp.]